MPESMSSLSGILLKRKQIRFSNLIFRFALNLRNTLGATKNGNTLVICLVPQSSDSFRRFLSITSTRYPFQTSHAYPVQKWPPQHKLQNTRTVSLSHFFCVKKNFLLEARVHWIQCLLLSVKQISNRKPLLRCTYISGAIRNLCCSIERSLASLSLLSVT